MTASGFYPGYHLRIRNQAGSIVADCTYGTTCAVRVRSGTWYRATVEDTASNVYGESAWWMADDDQATELSSGPIDLALATMVGSTDELCDDILVNYGSHVDQSTITDQEATCKLAEQNGEITIEALLRLAATAAGGAVLTEVYEWYIHNRPPITRGNPPPGGGGGGGGDGSTGTGSGGSVQHPLPGYLGADVIAAKLAANNKLLDLTNNEIQTIAEQCVADLGNTSRPGDGSWSTSRRRLASRSAFRIQSAARGGCTTWARVSP
jgi:hypothetical protein